MEYKSSCITEVVQSNSCGLNLFFLLKFFEPVYFYFPLCQIHYHNLKQRKIKIKLDQKFKPQQNHPSADTLGNYHNCQLMRCLLTDVLKLLGFSREITRTMVCWCLLKGAGLNCTAEKVLRIFKRSPPPVSLISKKAKKKKKKKYMRWHPCLLNIHAPVT